MSKNEKLCGHFEECRAHFDFLEKISEELCLTLQKMYCRSNCSDCARYKVYDRAGDEFLPRDLLPNQEVRAGSIVQEAGKLYS